MTLSPDDRALYKSMSVRERWRRGKLARSGQRITDPDEARRTAAYMRAVLQHMDPRRWSGWARALVILWVAWFVISTVIDLLLRRWGRLALSGGILLSFVYLAVLFLHIRGKFERTAEINSFELFE
jgi:hypothetical protein